MKTHTRRYYERLYRGKVGKKQPPVLDGKPLAEHLGYPARVLDSIPGDLWEDFLPCGDPLPYLSPAPGDLVLNLGCGAGVDSFALMLEKGNGYRIINADLVYPVLRKSSEAARRAFGDHGPEWVCADGEALPFAFGRFKWVVLNGVFNLFTDKPRAAAEISRVLERGGTVVGADLFRRGPLPGYFKDEPDAWAWCMSGALTREELTAVFESAGFERTGFKPESLDEFFDRAAFVFKKT